jgi:hypothetical protein
MHEIEVPCQPVFFLITETLKGEMLRGWGGGKGNVEGGCETGQGKLF